MKKLSSNSAHNQEQFLRDKKIICNQLHITPPSNATLLSVYRQLVENGQLRVSANINKWLITRPVRSLSGVAVISVLSKPYACPGKCLYCPSEPKMPKSYLSNEPAVMRAISNSFDPYRQVQARLLALYLNGHPTDKMELIVLGGTWSAYPWSYRQWFIKRCFDAANTFQNKNKAARTLGQAQKTNETTDKRIIGLILETRPDHINELEIKRLRQLGCTRIQLGVQALDNHILKINQRGHTVQSVIQATRLLKETSFKIDYHFMPNLAGSTPKKDLIMFKKLFTDKNFRPDHLKIYPTVVNKYAELYRWWQKGKWHPYSDQQLINLLVKMKSIVPYYVRINRLVRDIPGASIQAGNKITNLRQYLTVAMAKKNLSCHCIRCREVKGQQIKPRQIKLYIEQYEASGGQEYFISLENKTRDQLYAFCRLRFNDQQKNILPELTDCALIRELHTYGQLISLQTKKGETQHIGLGKRLMLAAEKIAQQKHFTKIAVIAGIGVRQYYQKLGYHLQGTYLIKNLK